MNEEIILVAETGSDLTPQQAQENGIYLVPMHVTMGDQTLDDGSFPPEEVCAYYQKTGTVPKTSASGPFDFKTVFDQLHEQFPDRKILHLAYSAVTTASYHNALLEGEHRDYVTSIDTKHVSVGQAAVVLHAAKLLREQHEPFAIIAAQLIQICALFPDHGDIVSHAAELSIMGHEAVKGLLLIDDQLDVQPAFPITGIDLCLQACACALRQRAVLILTHAVPRTHRFCDIHSSTSIVCFTHHWCAPAIQP